MDGMSYQPALPVIGVPDRSPLDMPGPRARRVLQCAAVQLRNLVTETGCMATEALADALEEASAGETEAACQALREAQALGGMRA
jgi:hypothetical protein